MIRGFSFYIRKCCELALARTDKSLRCLLSPLWYPLSSESSHLTPVEQMWLCLSEEKGAECVVMLRQVWYFRISCGQHMFRQAFWSPGIQARGALAFCSRGFACASCSGGAFLSDMVDWDGSGEVAPAGVVLGVPFG